MMNENDFADEADSHYDGLLAYGDCNSWDGPIFFVDSSEGGHAIIYDDQKENVRYCVIVTDRYDNSNAHDIFLGKGKAWDGGKNYKYDKSLDLKGNRSYNYKFFLAYKDGKIDQNLSIEKMKRLVDRFLSLRAFI